MSGRLDKVKQRRLANMKQSEEIYKRESPVEEIAKLSLDAEISPADASPAEVISESTSVGALQQAAQDDPSPLFESEKEGSKNRDKSTLNDTATSSSGKENTAPSSLILDSTYKISQEPSGIQSISIQFAKDALQFIMIRRAQEKMKIQDYIGLLIRRDEEQMKDVVVDPYAIERPERTVNVKKTIHMSAHSIEYLREISAMHGFTPSEYMNYMVKKEMQKTMHRSSSING